MKRSVDVADLPLVPTLEKLAPRRCPIWLAILIALICVAAVVFVDRSVVLPAWFTKTAPNIASKINLGVLAALMLITLGNFAASITWCAAADSSGGGTAWTDILRKRVTEDLGLARDSRRVDEQTDKYRNELKRILELRTTLPLVFVCGLAVSSAAAFVASVQSKGGVMTPLGVLIRPMSIVLSVSTAIVMLDLFACLRAIRRVDLWKDAVSKDLTRHVTQPHKSCDEQPNGEAFVEEPVPDERRDENSGGSGSGHGREKPRPASASASSRSVQDFVE